MPTIDPSIPNDLTIPAKLLGNIAAVTVASCAGVKVDITKVAALRLFGMQTDQIWAICCAGADGRDGSRE